MTVTKACSYTLFENKPIFDFTNGGPKYKLIAIGFNWRQVFYLHLVFWRKDTRKSNILEGLRIDVLMADGWNRANARTMSYTGYNRMVY